jgi:hypothetical protein
MKHLLLLLSVCAIAACSNSKEEKALADIKALESNNSFAKSDTLINSYINFSDAFPQHRLAPLFLFKAAQTCIKAHKDVKGARLYERMAIEYQVDSLAPEALIRGGISYAAASDQANAKRLYDLFIAKFPQHPRIEEVKKWSEYAGMTEEEMIRQFEQEVLSKQDSAKTL